MTGALVGKVVTVMGEVVGHNGRAGTGHPGSANRTNVLGE